MVLSCAKRPNNSSFLISFLQLVSTGIRIRWSVFFSFYENVGWTVAKDGQNYYFMGLLLNVVLAYHFCRLRIFVSISYEHSLLFQCIVVCTLNATE